MKVATIPEALKKKNWTHQDLFRGMLKYPASCAPCENTVRNWASGAFFPNTVYSKIVEKVLGMEVAPCRKK